MRFWILANLACGTFEVTYAATGHHAIFFYVFAGINLGAAAFATAVAR